MAYDNPLRVTYDVAVNFAADQVLKFINPVADCTKRAVVRDLIMQVTTAITGTTNAKVQFGTAAVPNAYGEKDIGLPAADIGIEVRQGLDKVLASDATKDFQVTFKAPTGGAGAAQVKLVVDWF